MLTSEINANEATRKGEVLQAENNQIATTQAALDIQDAAVIAGPRKKVGDKANEPTNTADGVEGAGKKKLTGWMKSLEELAYAELSASAPVVESFPTKILGQKAVSGLVMSGKSRKLLMRRCINPSRGRSYSFEYDGLCNHPFYYGLLHDFNEIRKVTTAADGYGTYKRGLSVVLSVTGDRDYEFCGVESLFNCTHQEAPVRCEMSLIDESVVRNLLGRRSGEVLGHLLPTGGEVTAARVKDIAEKCDKVCTRELASPKSGEAGKLVARLLMFYFSAATFGLNSSETPQSSVLASLLPIEDDPLERHLADGTFVRYGTKMLEFIDNSCSFDLLVHAGGQTDIACRELMHYLLTTPQVPTLIEIREEDIADMEGRTSVLANGMKVIRGFRVTEAMKARNARSLGEYFKFGSGMGPKNTVNLVIPRVHDAFSIGNVITADGDIISCLEPNQIPGAEAGQPAIIDQSSGKCHSYLDWRVMPIHCWLELCRCTMRIIIDQLGVSIEDIQSLAQVVEVGCTRILVPGCVESRRSTSVVDYLLPLLDSMRKTTDDNEFFRKFGCMSPGKQFLSRVKDAVKRCNPDDILRDLDEASAKLGCYWNPEGEAGSSTSEDVQSSTSSSSSLKQSDFSVLRQDAGTSSSSTSSSSSSAFDFGFQSRGLLPKEAHGIMTRSMRSSIQTGNEASGQTGPEASGTTSSFKPIAPKGPARWRLVPSSFSSDLNNFSGSKMEVVHCQFLKHLYSVTSKSTEGSRGKFRTGFVGRHPIGDHYGRRPVVTFISQPLVRFLSILDFASCYDAKRLCRMSYYITGRATTSFVTEDPDSIIAWTHSGFGRHLWMMASSWCLAMNWFFQHKDISSVISSVTLMYGVETLIRSINKETCQDYEFYMDNLILTLPAFLTRISGIVGRILGIDAHTSFSFSPVCSVDHTKERYTGIIVDENQEILQFGGVGSVDNLGVIVDFTAPEYRLFDCIRRRLNWQAFSVGSWSALCFSRVIPSHMQALELDEKAGASLRSMTSISPNQVFDFMSAFTHDLPDKDKRAKPGFLSERESLMDKLIVFYFCDRGAPVAVRTAMRYDNDDVVHRVRAPFVNTEQVVHSFFGHCHNPVEGAIDGEVFIGSEELCGLLRYDSFSKVFLFTSMGGEEAYRMTEEEKRRASLVVRGIINRSFTTKFFVCSNEGIRIDFDDLVPKRSKLSWD